MQHTYQNLKGTTSKEFHIGKSGVQLISSDTVPDNSIGVDGKSYCFVTALPPRFMYKTEGQWMDVGAALVIMANTSRSIEPSNVHTMVMVDSGTEAITLTITGIPPSGYIFNIVNSAGDISVNPVTVNFETDGVTQQTFNMNTPETLNLISTGSEIIKY